MASSLVSEIIIVSSWILLLTCRVFANHSYHLLTYFLTVAASKNDFKEEKYAWMEKWIHIGAYLPPLSYAIVAEVNGWFRQSYAFCTVVKVADECVDDYRDPSCHSIELYLMRSAIVFTELLIATIAMIILLCNFNRSMIERVGSSGGMNIVAKARTQRFNEVVRQSGLYMISCWLCYVPMCIQSLVWITSGMIYYNLAIVSLCLCACQGIVITVIYFALQRKSKQEIKEIIPGRGPLANANHETVSMIRANAARPTTRSSLRGASSSRKEFSFNIFDGCPDEDSPWAAYLYGDEMDETNVFMSEAEEEAGMRNDLSTSLLEDHLHS